SHEMHENDRHWLAACGGLPITVLKNDFGRALDQTPPPAAAVLVERGHELVLRLERDGVDAGIRVLLGPPLQPELVAEGVQRPFGRGAFDFPDAFLLPNRRVVAEYGDVPHELEHRVVAGPFGVLANLPLR